MNILTTLELIQLNTSLDFQSLDPESYEENRYDTVCVYECDDVVKIRFINGSREVITILDPSDKHDAKIIEQLKNNLF